jgi:hypothetical protein
MAHYSTKLAVILLEIALTGCGRHESEAPTEAPSQNPPRESYAFSGAKVQAKGESEASRFAKYVPQARRDLRCLASRCRDQNGYDSTIGAIASIRFELPQRKASVVMVSPGPEHVGVHFIDCLEREMKTLDREYANLTGFVVTIPVFGADHPLECERP